MSAGLQILLWLLAAICTVVVLLLLLGAVGALIVMFEESEDQDCFDIEISTKKE